MNTLFEEVMNKLEKIIKKQGSIRSLAEKLDLNPSTVSRWFPEKRSPDFRMLAVIFEYLDVKIVFPEDMQSNATDALLNENTLLKHRLDALERERDMYKNKWDGYLETIREEANAKEYAKQQGNSPIFQKKAQ